MPRRRQHSSKQKPSPSFLQRCHNGVNIFLVVLLALQGALVGILLRWDSVPVPAFVLGAVDDYLGPWGLEADWKSVSFDLRGRVLMSGIRLDSKETRQTFVRAKALLVDFNVLYLLSGKSRPQHISLAQGSLNLPAIHSPSGIDEQWARAINFDATWGDEGAISMYGRGLMSDIPVTLAATGLPPAKREKAESAREAVSETYIALCREVLSQTPYFKRFTSPTLRVSIDQQLGVSLECKTEAFRGPDGIEARGLHMYAYTGAQDGGSALHASVEYFNCRDLFEAHRVKATSDLTNFAEISPETLGPLRIACGYISHEGKPWNGLAGTLNLKDYPRIATQGGIYRMNNPAWFSAQLDIGTLEGSVAIDSALAEETLDTLPVICDSAFPDFFAFDGVPRIRASAQIGEGGKVEHAEFSLLTGALLYQGSPLRNMWMFGTVSLEDLDVQYISLGTREWILRGIYRESFTKADYRMRLTGTLIPEDLNPTFDDWWDELWTNFTLDRETPPEVDLDVRGNWKVNEEQYVVGVAKSRNIILQGLALDTCSTKLHIDGINDILIHDIRATRPEGGFSGWLQWLINTNDTGGVERRFSLESHLDFPAIAPIMDADLADLAREDIQMQRPPTLNLKGRTYNTSPGSEEVKDLRLRVESNGPLTLFGLPVDDGWMEGSWVGDTFRAEKCFGTIGNGTASGEVAVITGGEQNKVDFKINAKDIDYNRIKTLLAEKDGPADENGVKGTLDLDTEGNGFLGDLASFAATGKLAIRNADLRKVHLLGVLSKVLSGTWLGFSTLSITDAETPFTLRDGILNLPDIKARGSNALIKAKGDMRLTDSQLDFKINVYLGKEAERTGWVVLKPVFTPLGEFLQLTMRGTLEDPQVRLLVDPRNIFSKSGPLEPITTPAPEEPLIEEPLIEEPLPDGSLFDDIRFLER